MKIRVTKRGEVWSCCSRWQYGEQCSCPPYIIEFFDRAGTELQAQSEGPRRGGKP